MQHYWGAQAICERIGYKAPNRLPDLIIRYQLPCFKRRSPQKPSFLAYYTNEAMLSKWELARAQRTREDLLFKQEARKMAQLEKQRYSQRGIKKTPSPDQTP